VVAYRTADPQMTTRLTWFDRTGRATGWAGSPAAYEDPSLSPDGSRVAVQRWDTPEHRSIWIIDAERGTETRLTTNPDDLAPLWSPDGTRIVFTSARDTPPNLFVRSLGAADSTEDRLFSSRLFHMPTGWSRDGRLILYDTLAERTGFDILAYDRSTRASTPLLQTSADEQFGSLSADGRWLLYQSDETGTREVYVRPAGGSGAPTRISTNGGKYPAWRRDGREIFYVEGSRRLMSVALATGATPTPGPPSFLFEASFGPANRLPYDVSADGKRVLVNLMVNEAQPSPITIVMNWAAMPAGR
jgi:eukaryotic-like serine/threonine-protein kinase